jgi:hypothetical protein
MLRLLRRSVAGTLTPKGAGEACTAAATWPETAATVIYRNLNGKKQLELALHRPHL